MKNFDFEGVTERPQKNRGERGQAAAGPEPEMDRLPPHDEGMEIGVLSCLLQEPMTAMGRGIERRLAAAWFYDMRHQTIYNALRAMYDAGTGIDLITVQGELKNRGVLEEIGGIVYLSQVQDVAPSASNLDFYLDGLRDKYRLRRVIRICTNAVGRAYDYQGGDVEKMLLGVEGDVSALTEEEVASSEQTMREVMRGVIADMEAWHYARGSQQLRGLPTGPAGNYLDKVLTGIRETHFVTVAARPGGGKSALALNIVEYLAEHHVWYETTGRMVARERGDGGAAGTDCDGASQPQTAGGGGAADTDCDGASQPQAAQPREMVPEVVRHVGMPVGVFSIEMDNESLGYRLMFGRAGVSEAKFNQGFAEKGDAEKLVTSAHQLAKLNIILDDTPAQTIGQIAAKARRWAKQYGIKLFVLDYLQLAESDDPRDEARVRVNKISKKIMSLKKQLKIPWLVLAQLNRNIETAERDRNPVLSDLAESGAIEQDSDKVIILKNTPRRELEAEKKGADGEAAASDKEVLDRVCGGWEWSRRPRRVDAWVVKNRRGPTGKAEMVFTGNLCRFEDWHLFKVKHGIEERKAGESKHLGTESQRPPEQPDFEGVAAGA